MSELDGPEDIVLYEGAPGDQNGDGWLPELVLQHNGREHGELYVVVGEEAGGMIEGISLELFRIVAARNDRLDSLEKILNTIAASGDGSLVIRFDSKGWSLMSVFGEEAEDSPMVGGSHIGASDSLDECLKEAAGR